MFAREFRERENPIDNNNYGKSFCLEDQAIWLQKTHTYKYECRKNFILKATLKVYQRIDIGWYFKALLKEAMPFR